MSSSELFLRYGDGYFSREFISTDDLFEELLENTFAPSPRRDRIDINININTASKPHKKKKFKEKVTSDIFWTSTGVTLQAGRCLVHGYFSNNCFNGVIPGHIKIIVDVKTTYGAHIWSGVRAFNSFPPNCYIPAGGSRDWTFPIIDGTCPRWSGNYNWNVNWQDLSGIRI